MRTKSFTAVLLSSWLLLSPAASFGKRAYSSYGTKQNEDVQVEFEVEETASQADGYYSDWKFLKSCDSDATMKEALLTLAEGGDTTAMFKLACMYFHGKGAERDFVEALKWNRAAGFKGHALAQNNLGYMYQEGKGTKKNLPEALKWFQTAANYGCATAQCNYAYMLEQGIGVPKNMPEALTWYQKAADQGNSNAKRNLYVFQYAAGPGKAYTASAGGVPSKPAEAPAAPVVETPAEPGPKAGSPQLTQILKRLTDGREDAPSGKLEDIYGRLSSKDAPAASAKPAAEADSKQQTAVVAAAPAKVDTAQKAAEAAAAKQAAEAEKAAKIAEAQAAKKAAEAEKLQKLAEADAAKKAAAEAEKAKKIAEAEAAKKEVEAKKLAEAEAAKKLAEAESIKKAEAAQKVAEAEAAKKKLAEAEEAKKVADAAAAKKAEAEAKKVAEAEAAKKLADAEAAKKVAEAEAAKKIADAEAAKKLAEAEAAKKLAEAEKAKKAAAPPVVASAVTKPAASTALSTPVTMPKAATKPATGKTEASDTDSAAEPQLSPSRPVRDKWALVVGISKFENQNIPHLKYSAKDAADFYSYLVKDGGFAPDHVRLLLDEKATFRRVMSELGTKFLARVAKPDDLVVLFFSTHGSPSQLDLRGKNYLVAHDSDPHDLFSSGIEMQKILESIQGRVLTDRVLLVLDACHSGFAGPNAKGMGRTGNFDANELAQGSGQLVLCSSQPSEQSWESTRYQNGIFTRKLLQGLKAKGSNTTLVDAYNVTKKEVADEVREDRAGVRQTPLLKGKWNGNDLIVAVPPAAPQLLPAAVKAELEPDSSSEFGIRMVERRVAMALPTETGPKEPLLGAGTEPTGDELTLNADYFKVDGDARKLLPQYAAAFKSNPKNPADLYFLRAKAYLQLKDWQNAMNDMNDAIQLAPNKTLFYLARAYVYHKMGRDVLSREDIEQARFFDARLASKINFSD